MSDWPQGSRSDRNHTVNTMPLLAHTLFSIFTPVVLVVPWRIFFLILATVGNLNMTHVPDLAVVDVNAQQSVHMVDTIADIWQKIGQKYLLPANNGRWKWRCCHLRQQASCTPTESAGLCSVEEWNGEMLAFAKE